MQLKRLGQKINTYGVEINKYAYLEAKKKHDVLQDQFLI